MLTLIKLPFKLLALPLILIFATAAILIKLINTLSTYMMGPLMLFILGCGIYSAMQQMWTSVGILVFLELLCVGHMCCVMVVETKLDSITCSLIGFLSS